MRSKAYRQIPALQEESFAAFDQRPPPPPAVLEVEDQAGDIFLRPTEEPALALEHGVLVFTGEPDGDLEDAVFRHREDRARMPADPESE